MALSDDIKSRLDILDVVSQYVTLQKSGRSFKALCPFHAEKTPSFSVFPERQSWHCFGACATGGDIFNFLMRADNLSFGEALRKLAQQAGISIHAQGQPSRHKDLYHINEEATKFFQRRLVSPHGNSARAYLEQRGLTPPSIERFRLGLSPADGESLMNYLTAEGCTPEQLATSGVIIAAEHGRYRDLLNNRLVFPIVDTQNRVAGFAGRSMDDTNPKYLNSPTTPIFDKGSLLYGFNIAKDSIKEKGAVLVEGYMDVILPHQYGSTNVVCSMGTALTDHQSSLLRESADEVVLALDSDAAGQEATFRTVESSWRVFQHQLVGQVHGQTFYRKNPGPTLKVAVLPQGKDPDEIIIEDPRKWQELISKATPLMDYLQTALSSRLDLSTPEGKSQAAEMLFPLITAMSDPIAQEHQFRQLSTFLGVSQTTLEASLGRPWAKKSSRTKTLHKPTSSTFSRLDHDPIEEHCLSILINHIHLKHECQDLTPEQFMRPENREVFTWWTRCSTIDELRDVLDPELTEHLDYLENKPLPTTDTNTVLLALKDCVRRLKERRLRELKAEEEIRLSQSDLGEMVDQQAQILQLNENILRVFTKGQ